MHSVNSPIGVFDSGLGGVSVLKELYKLMPNENFLYFGDSKNAPYGTRPIEEIRDFTVNAVKYLISRDVKAVVIGCNTATSAAAATLREEYMDIPIIGLEPAVKPAALSGEHPTVVVMATPLTLKADKFNALADRFKDECEIIRLPAPNIVKLVESDKMGSPEMRAYIEELYEPFDKSKIDCVVLGCTHFPFARKEIQEVLGERVKIFDGAEGAARQTKRLLEQKGLLNPGSEKGEIVFENSDETKIKFLKELFEKPI